MNFTLTKDGFRAESEDFVSVDEIVRDALAAGFNVEIEDKMTTVCYMVDGDVITEKKKATVITIKS